MSSVVPVEGFTSFLEIMFAVNVAFGIWESFIQKLTFQSSWRNYLESKDAAVVLVLLENEDIAEQYERSYEQRAARYKKRFSAMARCGQVLSGIVALAIVVMLWLIGYSSGGYYIAAEQPRWVVCLVTGIVVTPFLGTSICILFGRLVWWCASRSEFEAQVEGQKQRQLQEMFSAYEEGKRNKNL